MPQILALLHAHAWTALAALVIGLLAVAAKSPAIGSPLARIPRQWRPHVVLALGVASGILSAVVAGTPWVDALVGGIVSAGLAVLVHGVAGGLSPENPEPPTFTAGGGNGFKFTPVPSIDPVAVPVASGERPMGKPDLDFGDAS